MSLAQHPSSTIFGSLPIVLTCVASVAACAPLAPRPAAVASDPLAAQNDGPARTATWDFVDRVTDPAGE